MSFFNSVSSTCTIEFCHSYSFSSVFIFNIIHLCCLSVENRNCEIIVYEKIHLITTVASESIIQVYHNTHMNLEGQR